MFAVIFKAKIAVLDTLVLRQEYQATAKRMQDLAMNEYGCQAFTSCTEGNNEIAISYWETQEQIRQWKQNAEHLMAQSQGRSRWYDSYSVEIVEVIRQYQQSS